MNLFKLSWRFLWAKPLNTLLSLMLLTLGVGIISNMLLLREQLWGTFERNIQGIDMVVGAKGSPLQLILSSVYHIDNPTGNISLSDANKLASNPLIKKRIPLAYGDSYRGFRVVGSDTSYTAHYDAKLAEGRYWERAMEVTVGATAARALDLNMGDQFFSNHGLGFEGEAHEDRPFTVVGLLEPSGTVLDQLLLTDISSLWVVHEHEHEEGEEHEEEEKEITAVLVSFRGAMGLVSLPRLINENTDMQAALPAYEINRLFDLLGVGLEMLNGVALAIIFISGVSVFISLFNSLKERKYEMALMRSMGASRKKLFVIIMFEGLILTLMGFLLGLITSRLSMLILQMFVVDNFHYTLSPWRILPEEGGLLAATLLIGLLAASIPAIRAFKLDIHRTLADA